MEIFQGKRESLGWGVCFFGKGKKKEGVISSYV